MGLKFGVKGSRSSSTQSLSTSLEQSLIQNWMLATFEFTIICARYWGPVTTLGKWSAQVHFAKFSWHRLAASCPCKSATDGKLFELAKFSGHYSNNFTNLYCM